MSNRNFDSRVIIQRLQNQNYARNLYQTNVNGQTLLTNPQNSDGTSSRLTTFVPGAQTEYFRGLVGEGGTVSLGGTFGVSATTTSRPSPDTTITGITAGNQRLTVAFSPPTSNGNSPIFDYEYSINNGATFTSARTTASPLLITGLTNGTTYQVVLRAVNGVGRSEPSVMVEGTPSTLPSPPTGLSGAPNDKQMMISFTAGNNGGSTIVNYQYSTDNGATYRVLDPVDTSSPITITKLSSDGTTDLTNGVAYFVRLKAVNGNGVSTGSSAISVTPLIVTEPPAPVDLSGVGGDQTVYILFTQNGDGGSAITNYEYSVNGGSFIACDPAQTFSPVEIRTTDGRIRLTNGTSYTITLKAVNVVGPSVASAATTATTTVNSLNTTSLLVELDANNASSYSGSGTAWTNLRSGGSYSAALQNAPLFDNVNKYFTFDGTNQIAQIAAAAAINPTAGSSFTAQIWARVNTSSPQFGSFDGVISKQFGASSYDGYSLSLIADSSVQLTMNGNSVNGRYSSTTGVYSNGWALYTIVVRFGLGSNDELVPGIPSYAYVSTRRVVTDATNVESGLSQQAPIQFPRGIQESGSNFCPADVGAFYLYNRAVSQEDIIRNYDATKARYGL
jgi:hypothetical protein